jgi:uncharacterized protein YndB with AHSA1/START domain
MTPAREIKFDKSTRTVEDRVEIAAPIDAVWRALTEAEELARWFPIDATVTPGPGGKIWLRWDDVFEWKQRIEIWEPNRHLRTTYSNPDPKADSEAAPPIEIAIDFHLEAKAGVTALRVVHSGFGADAAWDTEYDGVTRGWRYELQALRHYLERHPGVARKVVWVRKTIKVSAEEAWQRLMGPNGLLAEGGLAELTPGARYSLRSPAGDDFIGIIKTLSPPFEFSGTVENLGDSLIRIAVEHFQVEPMSMIWLATYGLSQVELDQLRVGLQAMLDRFFPNAES